MIIHKPTRTEAENGITLSARVELQSKRTGVPTELWFRFPADTGLEISSDVDPFVVALLLVAMQNGESIQVESSLSRKLLAGLHEYQRVYHSWYPERFQIIEVNATDLRDDVQPEKQGRACAFSGGVDSFYTLLSLRKQTGSTPPLTHTLFMAGFDMPLNLTWSIEQLTTSYAAMMKKMGIGFIAGSTNVRGFVNTVDWTNAHGQALAASALFFKSEWGLFFVPASYTSASYPKWGTHPSLDPLLSTETMEFQHHGSEANRVRKLAFISQSPETYERLRVCWIQDIGLKNCGECEKCIRTMIALEILGVLDRYRTFGAAALTRAKTRQLPQRTHQGRLFARELISEALRRGKLRICFDLGYSLARRKLFHRLLNPLRKRKRQSPDSRSSARKPTF